MGSITLYCLLYAGAIVFLAGCIVRALSYSRQPLHLRWEIYPVPHGPSGELKIMVPEILFLKGLWDFNRPMWFASFPFHFGLYLISAGIVLLCCAAVAPAALFPAVFSLCKVCGMAGAVLALLGSLGLLLRRLTVPELRKYSSPADFLNLSLFAVTVALLLAGEGTRPESSAGLLEILRGAATFDTTLQVPGVLGAGIAIGMVLLAYIPMTHMSHFIAKYFTYHGIRWDERANVPGGVFEKRMAEYLMYKPSWSAPHIGAGDRTWAQIATTNPTKGAAK